MHFDRTVQATLGFFSAVQKGGVVFRSLSHCCCAHCVTCKVVSARLPCGVKSVSSHHAFRSSCGTHGFLTITVNWCLPSGFFLHHSTLTHTELPFLSTYLHHFGLLDFKITQDSITLYYYLFRYSNYATIKFIQFI